MGFKENLKSELKYQAMSVKKLADSSGVNIHSINNYLNAREQTPSVEVGVLLAKTLGVSVEYLVTGDDTHNQNRTARLILKYAEQLDPQKREFALEFIKWLSAWKDKVG